MVLRLVWFSRAKGQGLMANGQRRFCLSILAIPAILAILAIFQTIIGGVHVLTRSGSPLRVSPTPQVTWLHRDRRSHPGPRHWRYHRHLLARPGNPPAPAPVQRS